MRMAPGLRLSGSRHQAGAIPGRQKDGRETAEELQMCDGLAALPCDALKHSRIVEL